ncbi:aspartate aminotransferase family protein [Ferrimicrobium sp.]|uniref:aspartate aminotransferase family protein n=1 Tax=Ferrimicrobium sp. TaxID=2926050 RepID=UPI0026386842|nr:aspartate aminotransferase family protein [Ferrimicrobium sp.]MCL5974065.1 aspartate aminotransferase family protein [Actinomycetota bacterium]
MAVEERLRDLIDEQEKVLVARQPKSSRLQARAVRSLAGGTTSSWQIHRPQPIWVSHGSGSKVYDVDGNEYVDLHNGYGAMLVGHGHPLVVEAIANRARAGTHFAQPTEDAVVVAEDLALRFGLPLWRYGNSGTEATMDAVHLMRAISSRDKIIKIEGSYHGHHDSVQVSVYQEMPEIGPPHAPRSVPASSGIPRAIVDQTLVVPFNEIDVLERVLRDHPGEIAGMIIEPVMMNIGIIPPAPGYLERVRQLTREHGVLLAFDEVKTGFTTGPGGVTRLYGVVPDIVCLAKSLGGGVPCGAIGGSDEVMSFIANGGYDQVGTFNGNPLTMAAARAVLTQILDDGAYSRLDALREEMVAGCEEIIGKYELPAYVRAIGAKGAVIFSPTEIQGYRDFLTVDNRFSHAHWLYQLNNGVFLPPWGKAEQWTLSVQHTSEDVQRFITNFRRFAEALSE